MILSLANMYFFSIFISSQKCLWGNDVAVILQIDSYNFLPHIKAAVKKSILIITIDDNDMASQPASRFVDLFTAEIKRCAFDSYMNCFL